jgi:hypothetical protein
MGVLLATCAELPDGDEDGDLLLAALAAAGVPARWAVWTDVDTDWSNELVVLRSTWDYSPRRAEFLRWASAVPRLVNSADVVEWNTDKTYLADLSAAGVPTVPTRIVPVGEPAQLPTDGEYVLKPSIGAGSRGAGRFAADRHEAAAVHVEQLHAAGRTVLLQPYLSDVDTVGERALIYLDGRFSHAVTKGPMLPAGTVHPVDGWELFVEEQITAAEATQAELAAGERAVEFVRIKFGTPLYARVDLLPSAHGPVIVELELTEPSLFLQHADGAIDRFAAAIAARA